MGREVNRYAATEENSSVAIVTHLASPSVTPSEYMIRREVSDQLRAALDSMDATDREVLALRHFEHLSNAEAATILGLSTSAASNRYIRALERLRSILLDLSSLHPGPRHEPKPTGIPPRQ